tara:strand:+ start:677 stop:1078 length:402 start_codon:yes stop_codon:yes gene_type:complete
VGELMFIWDHIFEIFMKKYWNDKYRQIPVFSKETEGVTLGDFNWTIEGVNSITLTNNQTLTDRELMGHLLHQMCRHIIFEKHGHKTFPYGIEWQEEMRIVGFTGKINRWTDGSDRFTENEYQSIVELLPRYKQ